ncbi:MAG: glycoside hydrolase domain-containing protein [bacterium]
MRIIVLLLITILSSSCSSYSSSTYSSVNIWVTGEYEKVNPITGNIYEEDARKYNSKPIIGGYKDKNYFFDKKLNTISLQGARNEYVGFQVVIEGKLTDVNILVSDLIGPGVIHSKEDIKLFREWYIKLDDVWYPDALIPFDIPTYGAPFDIPTNTQLIPGQKNQAIWCDIYLPKDVPPGDYKGILKVMQAKKLLRTLNINLKVLKFTLPDDYSLEADLNDYVWISRGFDVERTSPRYIAIEERFHKMAREHGFTLNEVGYTQDGNIKGNYAPIIKGKGDKIKVVDWTEFYNQFNRYLSPKDNIFYECKRGTGRPLSHFLLPFNCNWPGKWGGDKNSTRYLTSEYRTEYKRICEQFEDYFNKQGWTQTQFQIYFNHKTLMSELIPWRLDEPRYPSKEFPENPYADYNALRYYAELTKEGFKNIGSGKKIMETKGAKFVFRVDIGRYYEYLSSDKRLDGYVGLWNIGMNNAIPDIKQRYKKGEEVWYYGSLPAVNGKSFCMEEKGKELDILWHIWENEVDGVCFWSCARWKGDDPYITLDEENGSALAFYPGSKFNLDIPIPSLRLKTLRRDLQTYEYMVEIVKMEGGDRKTGDAILKNPRQKTSECYKIRGVLINKIEGEKNS